MPGQIVFLSGPIGVGKSTLGCALAERLGGAFLDGDDFSASGYPWYACILQTSRRIVQSGIAAVGHSGLVIVAHPLRRVDWIFFKRSFADVGVSTIFVGLRARYSSIVDAGRGRIFTDDERGRIQTMIAEGYGARPFCDLIVDTDVAPFAATLAVVERGVENIIANRASAGDRSPVLR